MATRAFLLCGDEKAVQAVTQILDELEVSFEHSSEPAFSLKRLATQRFDLLIVDCDNVQNATQVFNSARASNLNKTSIAIAIVEGKAGVPNAFRLGASLVLTKPVALEQVRNTLRTGIGMTRKEAQDVKAPVPAMPVVTTPVVAAPSVSAPVVAPPVATTPVPPVASAPVPLVRTAPTPAALTPGAPALPVAPALGETLKATFSPSPAAEKPAVVPRPVSAPATPASEHKPALSNFTDSKAEPTVGAQSFAKAAAAAVGAGPAPARNFDAVFATPSAAEKPVAEKDLNSKSSATKVADHDGAQSAGLPLSIVDPLAEEDALDPVMDHGVPSFGGLGKQTFAGFDTPKRSGGKGLLVAAILLLLLGAGGYGAWATQPAFRKLVAWEYLNVMTRIAVLRGQPQVTASVNPPTPAPVAAMPTPTAAPAASPTDPDAVAGANQPAASAPVPAPGTSSSSVANPQPAPSSPADKAQKTAAVQPARQDTTPNHASANPTLLPASLPPTTVSKTPGSDLLEVPEDYADDQVVRRVHPTYPKQARLRKLHGTVVLQAIINKQGKVDSLQLVSGDPLLAQAAADAVKQWRYKPYAHNGEAADFQTRVTVDFKLP
jgi:periplasmic protein TonB